MATQTNTVDMHPPSILTPGTEAPVIPVTDQEGNEVSLKDFRGKKVILFFYPEANTPTCTKEACNMRDHYADLSAQGFEVIGISPDSERKQQNFKRKFELPYTLLADKDKKLTHAFGVWGEKKMYGRAYMGVHRTTFVIDEKGIISHVIEKVVSKDHANQILEAMNS